MSTADELHSLPPGSEVLLITGWTPTYVVGKVAEAFLKLATREDLAALAAWIKQRKAPS